MIVSEHASATFGIGMCAGNQVRVAIFLLQKNETVVRDRRNDEVGYVFERRLIIERGRSSRPARARSSRDRPRPGSILRDLETEDRRS